MQRSRGKLSCRPPRDPFFFSEPGLRIFDSQRASFMAFDGAVDRLKWLGRACDLLVTGGVDRPGGSAITSDCSSGAAAFTRRFALTRSGKRSHLYKKNADDIGVTFDLFVKPLKRVRALQWAVVRLGESR